MTAHSEFRKGQKVIVHLKGGGKAIGKYVGKLSNYIAVDDYLIPRKLIRQISIYKGVENG